MKASMAIAVAAALVAGCASMGDAPGPKAVAKLAPTKGNATAGTVTFEQRGAKVMGSGSITGLKANAEHGFHVHEKGDCSSGDGMSAGGHFNPGGKPHGPPNAEHHAGDMPSLKADASGALQATFRLSGVSLGSGSADLVGRGLIVHAGPDDYTTQPTGNSGARIACGVIRAK